MGLSRGSSQSVGRRPAQLPVRDSPPLYGSRRTTRRRDSLGAALPWRRCLIARSMFVWSEPDGINVRETKKQMFDEPRIDATPKPSIRGESEAQIKGDC
jgi:hypothetical protein